MGLHACMTGTLLKGEIWTQTHMEERQGKETREHGIYKEMRRETWNRSFLPASEGTSPTDTLLLYL